MEDAGLPPRPPTSTGASRKLKFPAESAASPKSSNNVPAGQKTQEPNGSNGTKPDDPVENEEARRLRRRLANRKSAMRTRERKAQHKDMLENSVITLETEIASLTPKLAEYGRHRVVLSLENEALKHMIEIALQDKELKDVAVRPALHTVVVQPDVMYNPTRTGAMPSGANSCCAIRCDQSGGKHAQYDFMKQEKGRLLQMLRLRSQQHVPTPSTSQLAAQSQYQKTRAMSFGTHSRGVPSLATQSLGTLLSFGTQSEGTLSFGMSQPVGAALSFETQPGRAPSLETQSGRAAMSFGTHSGQVLSFGTQSLGATSLGTQSRGALSSGTQPDREQSFGIQSAGRVHSFGTQSDRMQSFGTQSDRVQSLGTQSYRVQSFGTQSDRVQSLGTRSVGAESSRTQSGGALSFGIQPVGTLVPFGSQTVGVESSGTQTGRAESTRKQSAGTESLGTQYVEVQLQSSDD
ncbi:hypothetical protein H6P81_006465 [Aristolochia fimbriata]|uniref:BZIP domain-containing protein n=1 Tax=Aristolochia fimbriata TaxID=158543 RepID=A0AAV7EYL6_ARIFI|nr:hypothetical protein H6P81_006465 [Aristolochia fimbriata]